MFDYQRSRNNGSGALQWLNNEDTRSMTPCWRRLNINFSMRGDSWFFQGSSFWGLPLNAADRCALKYDGCKFHHTDDSTQDMCQGGETPKSINRFQWDLDVQQVFLIWPCMFQQFFRGMPALYIRLNLQDVYYIYKYRNAQQDRNVFPGCYTIHDIYFIGPGFSRFAAEMAAFCIPKFQQSVGCN